MVGCGRGCHLPVRSAVAEYVQRRPRDAVCNACKCYCPLHMTSGTFQGGYSAMFIASRWVLKREEGFCTLQNSIERTLLCLTVRGKTKHIPISDLCMPHRDIDGRGLSVGRLLF